MAGAKRLARAADFAGLLAWRKGTLAERGRLKPAATPGRSKVRPLQSSLAAFPWRKLATVAGEHYIRLTVARRRRYCTVFPSTKSAVNVRGQSPLRIKDVGGARPPGRGGREDFYLFEKSVTRGRPEGVISTESGAWKTCSRISRWSTVAGEPTRRHLPRCIRTTWSAYSPARFNS